MPRLLGSTLSSLSSVVCPIGDREIDEITAGHAPADEGKMIVPADGIVLIDKGVFVAESSCGFPDEIDEPARRAAVARDPDMGRANHIGQDHGFDALEFAAKSHLCGHFAAAVGVVAAVAVPVNVPSVSPVALRFFAVEEG